MKIAQNESPVSSGYGLHWAAIFLAPLVGATAAASGLLMVAGSVSLGIVGESLQPVCLDYGWIADECRPTAPPTTSSTLVESSTSTASTTAGSTSTSLPADDVESPDSTNSVDGDTSDAIAGLRFTVDSASVAASYAAADGAPTTVSWSRAGAIATPVTPERHGVPRLWKGGLSQVLSPIAAMLAFLFGFSERLFSRWVDRVVGAFDPNDTSAATRPPAGLLLADGNLDEGGTDERSVVRSRSRTTTRTTHLRTSTEPTATAIDANQRAGGPADPSPAAPAPTTGAVGANPSAEAARPVEATQPTVTEEES